MKKLDKILEVLITLLFALVFMILGIVVHIGIPIAALYIVYLIAKYLFTGSWG